MNQKPRKRKPFMNSLIASLVVLFVLFAAFRFITFHPKDIQAETVFSLTETDRLLAQGQNLKLLSWNTQYMAGKDYVFFYDEWDWSGPDTRPSRESIEATWQEAIRVILDEDPDVILLQEMHVGSASTDKEDQIARLMEFLPEEYAYYTSAYYWKAAFVPHPKIMGSAGMKLATISKYKIDEAIRYQLPIMPADPVSTHFNFKRAVLEVVLPVEGGGSISLMNTHMDAFAQGNDTMERQVDFIVNLLNEKVERNQPFVITGDFNLIPPGRSYSRLPDDEKPMFQRETEIKRLYDRFKGFPTLEQIDGSNWRDYLTHFPNISDAPDRVLDYFFVSDCIQPHTFYVRQEDTLHISDHFPMILEFLLN